MSDLERLVRDHLRRLHVQLQIAQAGVIVAAAALRHQNADRDEEVARILDYCVADRLREQLERTAELLASLQPFPTDPADIDSWDPQSGRSIGDRPFGEPLRAYGCEVICRAPIVVAAIRVHRRTYGAEPDTH